jgi:hypothetical protein
MFWYNYHNNFGDNGLEKAVCGIVSFALGCGAIAFVVCLLIAFIKTLITGE